MPGTPAVFLRCAKEKRIKKNVWFGAFSFNIPKVPGSVGAHLSPDPSSLTSQLLPMNYKSRISLFFIPRWPPSEAGCPCMRTLGFLWVIHIYSSRSIAYLHSLCSHSSPLLSPCACSVPLSWHHLRRVTRRWKTF